ncbi:MAG: alpha/beta hydrolase [Bacteroidales bacterium]|nr:alpha/beta hydrolase [Bacteroidales bacterium]
MKTIEFNNRSIHFNVEGEGNPIVLLHGFLESMEIWNTFTARLSGNYKVITIDLPGHGRTENIDETHTMELMADVVFKVLEALEVDQSIMVGHSMGGYAASAFAERYPEMLKGLVYFHSNAAGDTDEARKNRDRTIDIVSKDHHGFINNFIPDLFAPENHEKFGDEIHSLKNRSSSTSKKGIIAALRGMKVRKDRVDLLGQLTQPVLFIAGKQDKRLPVEKLMHQASLPGHSEVLLLNHVGHMGYIEAQETTLSALYHFAERVFS